MTGYVDIGIELFLRILLVVICFIAYAFLVSAVLPRLILRPRWGNGRSLDRGIKRYRFRGGRAVVYQPSLKMRRYVTQYILSDNDGRRYLKCRTDPRISTVKYEIVVYDASGKSIDSILVREEIQTKGYTRAVELPEKTAYVSLVVREVNSHAIDKRAFASYSKGQIALFFACNIIATVVLSLILRGEISNALDLFLGDSLGGIGFCAISAAVVGALCSWLIFLCNYSKGVDISSGKKGDIDG